MKKNRKFYLIGFYRKRKIVDFGDVIRVVVVGKINKVVVIGIRKIKYYIILRYDNNCIVFVDDNFVFFGIRVKVLILIILRKR